MITIPEYVYNDSTIEFVCPALELARKDAARMRAALTDPNWPDALDDMEYICHAFRALGFDTMVVSDALESMYNCNSLYGYLSTGVLGDATWEERHRVANLIRKAWCRHMRDHLEKTLNQG